MINKKIVLILGAGASSPLFPTGKELLNVACISLKEKEYIKPILDLGHTKEEIDAFRNALELAHLPSIDAFLEFRPEFIELGKKIIACSLIASESEERLLNKEERPNWYEYFWNKLSCSFSDFDKNNISIITFNYDRSLKHFLFISAINKYGFSEDKIAEKINKLKIIHLYGNLASLPWETSNMSILKRPYNNEKDVELIRAAADSIKIIHEGSVSEENTYFREARNILSLADEIYFLGFGYYQKNLERLKISSLSNKNIVGSAYHFTRNEVDEISGRSGNKIHFPVGVLSYDCLEFFRNCTRLN